MSITVTLPDGDIKVLATGTTLGQVASIISSNLGRKALAAEVNHELVDLSYPLNKDSVVKMITAHDKEGIEIIRHSTAHLLAHAVKTLFPATQVTIGPVIDNGFYYDFSCERAFTTEDLEKIESKMHELANQNLEIKRYTLTHQQAINFFQRQGESYKVQIIRDLPEDEILSLYSQGDFTDLCRGPHVPNTGKLRFFKLTKVSGAYWRGSAENEMLQRIYGTAWSNKKDLNTYLQQLIEAKKRDHRKLAKQMDLFLCNRCSSSDQLIQVC